MRKLIIALTLFSAFFSNAQKVSFVTENDTLQAEIQGYGEDRFITNLGYVLYDDIWVILYHGDMLDDTLVKVTSKNNIVLHPYNDTESHPSNETAASPSSQIASNSSKEYSAPNPVRVDRVPDLSIEGENLDALQNQINDLEYRIENFRAKRNTGFGMQTAGVALIILSVESQSNEMLLLGTALNLIGWIVNATAGKELKKRRFDR